MCLSGNPLHYRTDGYACAIQFHDSLPSPSIQPFLFKDDPALISGTEHGPVVAKLTRSSASS